MLQRLLRALSPLLLLSGSAIALGAEPLTPLLVVTPRAAAVAVNANSRPFLAATRVVQPVNLTAVGYSESEYIIRGLASRYEWIGEARTGAVAALTRGVPYATRILVRRPVDAARASGVVVLEVLDPSGLHDSAPLWGLSWQHFTRRGDVWVGVTVQPSAADTLRRFDAVRYGPLSFAFNQAANCLPAAPAGTPNDPRIQSTTTESGLAWDVMAQVGALLRSSSKENPLLAVSLRYLIAAGHAQGGSYVVTFANALHRVQRLGNGAPVFDAYLAAAVVEAAPINQCSAPLADADPRRVVMPRDVPFAVVMTEADFNRAPALRREDSDEPADTFRLYDIPGAGRSGAFGAGVPIPGDLTNAGIEPPPADQCAGPPSDYPVALVFNAIWQHYSDWLGARVPLARVPRIEAGADGQPVRDAHGNAQGGWRLPPLDLPLASYAGGGAPREASARAVAACAATGVKQAFPVAKLKTLYRDRAAYLASLRASIDTAVADRRLTPADGETLKNPSPRTLPAF